mgnify:CR=1 FL=1
MARNLRENGQMPPPAAPTDQPMRQIAMNPERQMMLRIWALEDEVRELQLANAELQTALAKTFQERESFELLFHKEVEHDFDLWKAMNAVIAERDELQAALVPVAPGPTASEQPDL